jgi:hypothetical protein
MGASLAQISIIVVLSVIGLPLFFFGLMTALDRFERSLSAQPRVVTPRSDAAPVAVQAVPPVVASTTSPDAVAVTIAKASAPAAGATGEVQAASPSIGSAATKAATA